MKIAFIGAGNMAQALMAGLIAKGNAAADILAIDPGQPTRDRCAAQYGVRTAAAANAAELHAVDVIVLAVKPQMLREVAAALAPMLAGQLLISVAAGISLDDLSRWLDGYQRLVRCMPNTPAQIGLGATGLAAMPAVDDGGRSMATELLQAVGITVWVEQEQQLDAVTAISGSGPAYVFYFIEALCAAGQRLGLDTEQARTLALATFNGAAQLAYGADESPSVLRERVTSKGGTTAAALDSFAQAGLQESIIKGALAASERAAQLGNEMGKL